MKKMFMLALPLLMATACDNNNDTPTYTEKEGRRTVLVYMAAQNSLGKDGYAKADSAEIMNGRQYLSDNDRMLMLIDDGSAPRLYRVMRKKSQPVLLKRWKTDICTTSPERLREVLCITREQFPAKEYGLVMWSHADGWIPPTDTDYNGYETCKPNKGRPLSFGIDCGPDGNLSNRGAQMSVPDIARAIIDAGIHCKYIFFDACLMQSVEVVYALRHATEYVVASPIATPGAGSYYTHNLQQGFFSSSPSDIARTYLTDVQDPMLSADYSNYGLTVSCVNTQGIAALAQVLRNLLPYSKLAGGASPEMVISKTLQGDATPQEVLNYQPYCDNYFYRPHNYDALQALRCLLPANMYAQAEQALKAAVCYYGSTERVWVGPSPWSFLSVPTKTNDYCAIGMFVPNEVYTRHASQTRHGDLNKAFKETEWYTDAGFQATGW